MNNLLSRIRNYGQSQDGVVTLIVVCTLVGAVGFNLWHLFPETTGGGIPVNDRLFHLALVDSAVSAITNGQDITDPWQGTMSLGFPVFHYYQHLPHVFFGLGSRPEFQGFYHDRSVELAHLPGPEPVPDIHILVAAPVQF